MTALKTMKQCAAALLPLIALSATGTAAADVVTVTIVDMGFAPADVILKAGDTVEWTNHDFIDHTATATDGGWDLTIEAGKSARHQFTQSGSLKYFCRYHPDMIGVVRVIP
ncbi:MAG: cupredoxin domain-containing protein [Hyphomicrobium sp.]